MTKYKCGCESDGIILMDTNIINYMIYEEWAKSVGVFGTKELCIYCWIKLKDLKEVGLYCNFKKSKHLPRREKE